MKFPLIKRISTIAKCVPQLILLSYLLYRFDYVLMVFVISATHFRLLHCFNILLCVWHFYFFLLSLGLESEEALGVSRELVALGPLSVRISYSWGITIWRATHILCISIAVCSPKATVSLSSSLYYSFLLSFFDCPLVWFLAWTQRTHGGCKSVASAQWWHVVTQGREDLSPFDEDISLVRRRREKTS